jgi:hypothetical protein
MTGARTSELPPEILERRICDFDLQIDGRALEPVIDRFRAELTSSGITLLQPAFYLSDEWGVPDGTVAIGIPFYLADDQLFRVHGDRGSLVEGDGEADILRYLRHEMGHVVNYAYRLFETPEWTALFGDITLPYEDRYPVVPFSRDFVRHLPGGYAQKHPDEDWSETFAVWMTPGSSWRTLYADAPGALRKLEYCERTMAALRDRIPAVTAVELDSDVKEITSRLHEYYPEHPGVEIPQSLDGDLQAIFGRRDAGEASDDAVSLLHEHRRTLAASVYRWTAVDPEQVGALISSLSARAGSLGLRYPVADREAVLIDLCSFLTMLAVHLERR